MSQEKKENSEVNQTEKYIKWISIIENMDNQAELGESNFNIYNHSLMKRSNITKEIFYRPFYLKSPSQLNGFSEEEEKLVKFYILIMIQEAGIILRVSQNTILTSQNIFNNFFWRNSLTKFEPFIIAIACFYIGCKIEETYRRMRDVISSFYKVFSKKKFGENKINTKENKNITLKEKKDDLKKYEFILDICSEDYKILKNNICYFEIQVFKELGFSLYPLGEHPHKYLTQFIKYLKGTKELLQKSWNYLNDAYKTDIPVHYPPHVIACSAVFLAARVFKLPLPRVNWWEIYETKIEEIQEICSELLNLNEVYKNPLKFSEISEILMKKSEFRGQYEAQEKAKQDIIEKAKTSKLKKDSNINITKRIKYDYRKRESISRSKSSKRKKYGRSSSSARKYKRYSSSSSNSSRSSENNESDESESSSSSIDAEKVKQRLRRKEKFSQRKDYSRRIRSRSRRRRRENKIKHSKHSRKFSNSESSSSSSYYSKDRKHVKRRRYSSSSD